MLPRFSFDKIYIAPNKIDLEVFNAITHQLILSKCVRQLNYDASVFMSDLTIESYTIELMSQTCSGSKMGEASPDTTDSQMKDWVLDLYTGQMYAEGKVNIWKDHSLIRRSYQVYQEHSVFQTKAVQSGGFFATLELGLTMLGSLKSVFLKGVWIQSNFGEHYRGSPLARTSNPFHCIPNRWAWRPGRDCPYGIITTALARATDHIDEFVIDKCILDHIHRGIPRAIPHRVITWGQSSQLSQGLSDFTLGAPRTWAGTTLSRRSQSFSNQCIH